MSNGKQDSSSKNDSLTTLLDGDMVERLRQLELFSSRRVEGIRTGDNPSPLRGFSSDFLQHRQYFPGDNLRYLDWRVLAKSDRLVVKQFEELTNAEMTLILDGSGSMGFSGDGMSKLSFSIHCAAMLFYIMYTQQDTFSLYVFNEEIADRVSPGGSRQRLRRIFEKMIRLEPKGQTFFDKCFRQVEARLGRKGIVVIFSDFMDDPKMLAKTIGRLRLRGHDVIAFLVYDPSEEDIDFVNFTRFLDMEDGGIIGVDPLLIRREYQHQFTLHKQKLKECFRSHGVDFTDLAVTDEYEKVAGDYLRRRMALMR